MSDEAAKGEAEVSQQTQPTSDEQEKNAPEGAPEESKEDDNAKPKPEKKEEKPQLSDPEEPDDGVPILLVTGASGYLASHIIKQLLEQGRFRVRGTVRSLENEKKVKPLRDLVPEAKYPLRLIEADLLKPTLWTEAVRRCSYVFHVASPLGNVQVKNPDVLIKPAVEGTTNVLKACAEAGTVKRVVVTSSMASVVSVSGASLTPSDHVYTEADWTDEAVADTYETSKLRAEKAAWDFVQNLDASKQFELVTVLPGFLEGPLLSPSHKAGSTGLVIDIVSGKTSRFPDVHFPMADVRDTAAAHIAALEKPEAAGNRYISITERLSLKEIGQIVEEEFKPQGYKISVKGLPKAAIWAAKFISSEAKFLYPFLGKKVTLSNEKMKRELGIIPRPVKESVVDVGYSAIDMGLVPKKSGYLGHPSTRPPEDAAKQDKQTS